MTELTRTSPTAGDRRHIGSDRRRRPTPALSRYRFTGRRRGGRRAGETRGIYVDRCAPADLALIGGTLFLTLLDLLFTTLHLDRGVGEANPLMAWTLDAGGVALFASTKVAITLSAVGFLWLHIHFRRARALLVVVLAVYAALFALHLLVASITRFGPA